MDDLNPVLTRFHREIVVPDMERIVGASVQRLRDEMHTLLDSIVVELKDLRQLYTMLSFAVKRIEEDHRDLVAAVHRLEERLGRVEERLGRVEKTLDTMAADRADDALRSEVADLRGRVNALQAAVRAMEKRREGE